MRPSCLCKNWMALPAAPQAMHRQRPLDGGHDEIRGFRVLGGRGRAPSSSCPCGRGRRPWTLDEGEEVGVTCRLDALDVGFGYPGHGVLEGCQIKITPPQFVQSFDQFKCFLNNAVYYLDMPESKEGGSHLRRLREDSGLALREAARRLGIGHTKLHHWEKTGRVADPETILRLAALYHVSVEELLGQSRPRPEVAPNSRLARLLSEVSRLPRKRQQRIVEVVEDMLAAQVARKSA